MLTKKKKKKKKVNCFWQSVDAILEDVSLTKIIVWGKNYYFENYHLSVFQKLRLFNWQKWKRVFLTCPYHEIYRDEEVGLKSCKYYDLCEYVEFGVISWKFDILSITA